MKTVIVAGAAGAVGRSTVRSLLATGEASVIAISRNAERLEALHQSLDARLRSSFTAITGDAGDVTGAEAIAERVKGQGIDAAVAIFGRGDWSSGPLLELSGREWQSVLDEMLTAHFAFARAFIPLLATRAGALYLSLGGGAAFAPVRDAGLMSIAAAGQLMLTRTLARERGSAAPRILELIVNGAILTDEGAAAARPGAITAAAVGRVVTELVLRGVTSWEAVEIDAPFVVMNERS